MIPFKNLRLKCGEEAKLCPCGMRFNPSQLHHYRSKHHVMWDNAERIERGEPVVLPPFGCKVPKWAQQIMDAHATPDVADIPDTPVEKPAPPECSTPPPIRRRRRLRRQVGGSA